MNFIWLAVGFICWLRYSEMGTMGRLGFLFFPREGGSFLVGFTFIGFGVLSSW